MELLAGPLLRRSGCCKYSSHRNDPLPLVMSQECPFTVIHVGKIGISGVIAGANSKSTFAPKTGYQPLFPSRGPVPGDLAMKFCSVVGARCLQGWRFFVRVRWPRFGFILRTQNWTHIFISLSRVNIGVQTWTHFRANFMDQNLVRQLEPKTHKSQRCGSNFRKAQLHCGKAAAAQAIPTNWRGTGLGQPVFGAKVDLLLGLST